MVNRKSLERSKGIHYITWQLLDWKRTFGKLELGGRSIRTREQNFHVLGMTKWVRINTQLKLFHFTSKTCVTMPTYFHFINYFSLQLFHNPIFSSNFPLYNLPVKAIRSLSSAKAYTYTWKTSSLLCTTFVSIVHKYRKREQRRKENKKKRQLESAAGG